MTVTKTLEDKILNVKVEGRLDTATAPELEKELEEVLGEAEELVFDFEGLEYMSSAGLRILLATQKKMSAKGGMKTIKEMSAWERRHFSLQAKTFHAVLVGALILGIVALITGLGLYVYSLSHEYVQSAFELTKNASNVMGNVVDVSSSCRKTIDIYQSIPEEDREVQDEEYFKKFTEVTEGPNYGTIMEVLRDFKGNSGVNDIFIGIYNREDNHLIYVADPDTNRPCPTGTWEEVRRKEVDKFLGWNGKGIPYEVTYTE